MIVDLELIFGFYLLLIGRMSLIFFFVKSMVDY